MLKWLWSFCKKIFTRAADLIANAVGSWLAARITRQLPA